jgi:hypothetical protein
MEIHIEVRDKQINGIKRRGHREDISQIQPTASLEVKELDKGP